MTRQNLMLGQTRLERTHERSSSVFYQMRHPVVGNRIVPAPEHACGDFSFVLRR